ncbi:MAG TPA: adenosine deaminase family protein [Gaiellaceae bacterium]|nr:adenosine deaminase family protein [Gaiellaceae bacterium]
MLEAAHDAAARSGVGVGVIVAAHRDRGPREASDFARLVAAYAGSGVVGFGLDGHEAAHPPALFGDAFAIAREAGLPSVPHAGEFLGAGSVADAVDLLGATRVMHGVRAIEDPALVQRLAREGVCLHVCPTSNVLMSVVPSMESHPLSALLSAGVRCSVNADDPLPFDTDLLREYERCRDVLGVTDEDLAAVARTSIEASAAPPEIVERALTGIASWLEPTP